jgi:type I restriction enzyme S subunit
MPSLTLSPGTTSLGGISIPDGWRALQLRDFCDFAQGGRLGLTKQDNYVSSGVPAYSAAGQDGYVAKTEYRDTRAVVLSAIGANCGRCFFAAGDWTTLANVQAIVPLKEVGDARFLFYRVNRDDYWPRSGSAQPFIKPSDIKSCWVALPPLAEQHGIARLLDTLDTTIRQTAAIIEKLNQVKQGLLHDLLTRGIGANGELRPPQSQAPHLYKDSPLGWIPREWLVQRLGDFMAADITYGIVQAGPHIDGGVPYIRTGDMSGNRLTRAPLLCTSRRIADSYRRSEVRAGEIVMAIRATVGKVLPVPPDLDGANLTQGTARLAPNERTDSTFLLWAIRHQRAQDSILAEIKGTTFAEITLSDLREVPLAAPADIAEQRQVRMRIEACEARIQQEERQRQKLQTLKSGLMDDLLTGRVRVTPLLA